MSKTLSRNVYQPEAIEKIYRADCYCTPFISQLKENAPIQLLIEELRFRIGKAAHIPQAQTLYTTTVGEAFSRLDYSS